MECPASVDIPKLMMEGKGSYVQINGLSTTDWLMTRIDRLSALGGRFPQLANAAIRSGLARWLMEKFLGIAQGASCRGSRRVIFCGSRPGGG